MPREQWLIDPAEFSDFQTEVRELDLSASYVITGCAGSGKTVLALYRVNDIRIEALATGVTASFTMIVHTKTLRAFIRSGVQQLKIDLRQVIHYEKWDGSEVDYIVVDEAQDFSKEKMDIITGAKRKSIMLYGDTQQQIYSGAMSTAEIATYLKLPDKELKINYRLPKMVASFASHLGDDKELENKCIKPGSQKPRLKRFLSWQSELDYIMNEINTRKYTDVGILLPFNTKLKAPKYNFHRNVQTVKEYFDLKGFRYEYKLRDNVQDNMELDFDSDLPKLIPFHSSKGLQFETVFIPFCDWPGHDGWFIRKYRKPLYVALTRTYRNLYMTYTERLTPFFDEIPGYKYE